MYHDRSAYPLAVTRNGRRWRRVLVGPTPGGGQSDRGYYYLNHLKRQNMDRLRPVRYVRRLHRCVCSAPARTRRRAVPVARRARLARRLGRHSPAARCACGWSGACGTRVRPSSRRDVRTRGPRHPRPPRRARTPLALDGVVLVACGPGRACACRRVRSRERGSASRLARVARLVFQSLTRVERRPGFASTPWSIHYVPRRP